MKEILEPNNPVEKRDAAEGVSSLARTIIERKERGVDFFVHEVLGGFEMEGLVPKRAVMEISRRLEKYEAVGADRELLKLQAEDALRDAVTMYRDERFEISNFGFFKEELFSFIDKVFLESELETVEDLDRTAMIFFDVDGLKAVNDKSLGLHKAGDIYLKKIAETFNSGRTTQWLESLGFEVSPARRSGDEFMYAIKANTPLTIKTDFIGIDGEKVSGVSFAEYVIKKIKQDIESLDMTDVQDFSDPGQREKYKGLIDEWPENFQFRASISGGGVSLLDAVKKMIEDGKGVEGRPYEELIARDLIGPMIDLSDKKMTVDKERGKETRRESGNESEQILEKIYRSGREEKVDFICPQCGYDAKS